ncbi:MAG TPA: prepilin peptidase [Alphaproteobacteria bacterium]|nr:prepilin peptidase [Alphaproteobacteria bacterium]HNS44634.1 prepilin peptidase [Alphaproteobacteria bacterium]
MVSIYLSSDPVLFGIVTFSFFLLGLCLGSFSSAVGYRACHGESWIFGDKKTEAARSKCPQCGHQLGFFDLIPLLSWIFLGGTCRYCKAKVGVLYPFLELVSGCVMGGYFFFLSGEAHPLVNSFLFAVFLPFVVASVVAVVKCRGRYPVSLGIMGLLSAAGMVGLSAVF